MELSSAVGESKRDVVDDTGVCHANESVNFVSFNVEALLGHDVGSLLWSSSREVRNKGKRVRLGSIEGINSNVHFSAACCIEQVMLLIKVEVSDTETCSECAS